VPWNAQHAESKPYEKGRISEVDVISEQASACPLKRKSTLSFRCSVASLQELRVLGPEKARYPSSRFRLQHSEVGCGLRKFLAAWKLIKLTKLGQEASCLKGFGSETRYTDFLGPPI